VFWAVFLGWVVDAFDFNILAFVLIDIQRTFTVDRALAGLLGTVTLIVRIVGAAGGGIVADRYGRRLPLILAIAWFSTFAFVSGTPHAMFVRVPRLFESAWARAVGMPPVRAWPTRRRGLASGLLMGGWYWGYLLAAVTFQFVHPRFASHPELGWRFMFWVSIVPAVIPLWIRWHLPDSPIWLERKRQLESEGYNGRLPARAKPSLFRIFHRDLIGTTVQTTSVSPRSCAFTIR
jgi:SHS family lactate transporter-like MFS transporter